MAGVGVLRLAPNERALAQDDTLSRESRVVSREQECEVTMVAQRGCGIPSAGFFMSIVGAIVLLVIWTNER